MSGSYTSRPFGAGRRPGSPRTNAAWWDRLEQLRESVEERVAGRGGGRDLRSAILEVLAAAPGHGYAVLRAIEERSAGAWSPTPGEVYPTLQLLADEGLVVAQDAGGRKVYSLTDLGRAEAQAAASGSSAFESEPGRRGSLPRAGAKLAQAAAQVAQNGSAEQIAEAVEALDEARRKLYSILARD
ncbi:PadR family transcriptional regulator [Naasia sp. SYSU D00057]|uniref:PadR family transcriptional regulator n=1 Tax=Naasia sp. SYSU D00057 TaxID=2817380 RepID=UPI001B30FA3F|nr:PadR family transcriptional regulator [Naasia sp. SYSU D00057]